MLFTVHCHHGNVKDSPTRFSTVLFFNIRIFLGPLTSDQWVKIFKNFVELFKF